MAIFNAEQKKIIALSSLGGGLEFFDFIVFIFLAKTISKIFFPLTNSSLSLMSTLAVFAVGYLARPLGGLVFGHAGDRSGRKKTFVLALLLMALPTFLIGLLPSYAQVGILAPLLLILLRLIQGFSLGGEIPGATVFVLESVNNAYRGFAVGLIFLGVNTGLLLGSLSVTLLTHFLSDAQLQQWGWRVPFLIGGAFGAVSFYMRQRLQETPAFAALQQKSALFTFPLKEIFRQQRGALLQGITIIALEAVIISIIYLFMPTYLSTLFQFSLAPLLMLNTLIILFFSIPILFTSLLSDKVGRKKMILFSALTYLVFSYPLFLLFRQHSWTDIVIGSCLLALIASPIAGCFCSTVAELFPTSVRYSGLALAYNIGFGIIGGLTPLIATWLIHVSGNNLAPAFCLMLIAAITLLTLMFVPETSRTELK